ncbi:dTDP-4-dehydrorhamnose reductase [Poseidonocella pacifica]|uniref:dTDP-4-dehydrorhamnose reductase n=1 Tax=Poseidonocella pacifica TaxID=871651 RepID=A0A1I0XTL2_9RHOB|nr:dTDP-4-dehydrorhamnose reductase [Poseidonocella pacifica]SFB04415.1 dTDP-4-dehydrorhamnose reductase [Poseidonocella pacifica]
MKLLVFGSTGQVATELKALAPEARFLARADVDLTDASACAKIIRESDAEAVINAAAYTAVDKAESEDSAARAINGHAPGAMAHAAAARGIPFVHISTDYVFDGSGDTPRTPDAPTAPLGAYGRTKLRGEEKVREAGGVHAILRTSWVFSAHGTNFVKTMLRLGAERKKLTIVADQIGGPTPAADIAAACLRIAGDLSASPDKSGTYHFSGAPDASWADFAREIFAQAKIDCAVEDIPTSAYPTPATRPLNSRLDCSSTETTFGIPRPDWHAGLAHVLTQLEKAQT